MRTITSLLAVAMLAVSAGPARAQLDQMFENIFNQVLVEDFHLSPGPHADHFIPASEEANRILTPALNSMIATNVASFPLSSTVAGITFDFSTGQPISVTESQGPIFAETAQTLGQSKIVAGMNATHLGLNRFRGQPVDGLRFTFTHEDTGDPGLGDDPNELDVVHLLPQLDIEADIVALFATYGLAKNLDVGLAVPLVRVSMKGEAQAIIESRTLFVQSQFGGGSTHFFGGDAQQPILENEVTYDESATGIGDLAVRLKYRFPFEATWGAATLLDVRLPTGDEENFMGTGSVSARLLFIASRTIGSFTPHLNLGYDYRGSDLDSDEVEFVLGFDQKIGGGVTFALDLLGDFDLSSDEAIRMYDLNHGPTTTIVDRSPDTGAINQREVALSNVPNRDFDHTVDLSAGFRVAPSERVQLLGNLMVPLQDGGLRSTVVPTLGLSINI